MAKRALNERRSAAKQPIVGFLGATTPQIWGGFLEAFQKRMRELGWIDGSNITIDYRWAEGQENRYVKIAKDFVRDGVDIIVTSGTTPTLAAKRATRTIPIVFAAAGDPVGTKLVKNLQRPGQNVTGRSNGQIELAGKRVDEFRKLFPDLKRLAIIGNLSSKLIPLEVAEIEKKARRLGIRTVVRDTGKRKEIASIIKNLKGEVDAIFVCTSPSKTANQSIVHTAAAHAALPTMHAFRAYVELGGLMSYGPDFRAMFGHAAELVDKILRGKKPAELPVKVERKCELVINGHTARMLGMKIPKAVRNRATIIG
jgi:putative ABC transport system substrate-binding protein